VEVADVRIPSYLIPIALVGLIALLMLQPAQLPTPTPPENPTPHSKPRAVIIDTQCLTHPNESLLLELKGYLEKAGYEVDVYSGDEVTVELLWRLPERGYRLVVFRAHSLLTRKDRIEIITGEPYSESRHTVEQLLGLVGAAVPLTEPSEENVYFSITEKFVRSLRGRFKDSVVIVSGCYSLFHDGMAQAFFDRGCSVYVGWNYLVTAEHADAGLRRLVYHYCVEGLPIGAAVKETMQEIGPDPEYETILAYTTRD